MNPPPELCVEKMIANDAFSKWLGIELVFVKKGSVKAKMEIREDMLNGFSTVHGGVLFAFADSAFAFACNTHNNLSVALSCSITYPNPAKVGDKLIAEAKELDLTNKTGVYDVVISNQINEKIIARFRGVSYRTGKSIIQ